MYLKINSQQVLLQLLLLMAILRKYLEGCVYINIFSFSIIPKEYLTIKTSYNFTSDWSNDYKLKQVSSSCK